MTAPRSSSRPAGFTLVELIVALLVGVILAGAVTGSLTQFSRAKARASSRQEATARANAAASRIAEDVLQVARDHDLTFAAIKISDERQGADERDSIMLLVRTLRPVRGLAGLAEGADAEVQYRVRPDLTPAARPALWRRADAPPDKNLEAGGVAQLIVTGITSLSIEATDGQSWFQLWDSDSYGSPHAVRITVTAVADDAHTTAVARRLVTIDRTPLPPPATDDTSGTGSSGSTTGAAR